MSVLKFRTLLVALVSAIFLHSGAAFGAAITVTQAHISNDFSTFYVESNISGFTDTGDISNQFAILGLQNAANQEEAISFALLTGYPSTGQSTPDHPIPPPPVGPGARIITITSAIVDHVLNQFSVTGILQGDWNATQAADYTVILGLQNNNNGDEAITFANNVTIPAPPAIGILAVGFMVLISTGRRSYRRKRASF
jgi:hypothetical protein